MRYFRSTYANKQILVTGHTGFKGSWLSVWLTHLGACVTGLSLDIPTSPSHFEVSRIGELVNDQRVDVRDTEQLKRVVDECQPDFVFHLAAQSLVRSSYEDPLATFSINAIGSANILDALRTMNKNVIVVMITSDKVYDNVEWVWGYRETDRLGGKDPYSASKGMAELAIRAFIESYFNSPESNIRVGITRAGNVIGGGDWARDRIVPDCMKAWAQNKAVEIRNPASTRPWQHVLEPLSGYLTLGAELYRSEQKSGNAYNFGPPASQNHSVQELIEEMSHYWDNVSWRDISKDQRHLHEAGLLKLNCDKALFDLQWQPALQFKETVRMTVQWYKRYYQNESKSMLDFTLSQVDEYAALAEEQAISWTKER